MPMPQAQVLAKGYPPGQTPDATHDLILAAGELRVAADGDLRLAEPTGSTVERYRRRPAGGARECQPQTHGNPALHLLLHRCLFAPIVRMATVCSIGVSGTAQQSRHG